NTQAEVQRIIPQVYAEMDRLVEEGPKFNPEEAVSYFILLGMIGPLNRETCPYTQMNISILADSFLGDPLQERPVPVLDFERDDARHLVAVQFGNPRPHFFE